MLVRGVPATFARALCATTPDPPIDVARAREQHAAYVDGLRWLGFDVETIAPDDAYPDCCFVEDAAVVADGVALVTRPGASERRGETAAISAVLATHARLEHMVAPATLDGGDVLRLGRRFFVGRSARTNEAGIARLAEVFAPLGFTVMTIEVAGLLHLKSACSPLDDRTIVCAEGAFAPRAFGDAVVVLVPAGEATAANTLARARRALISAGHPRAQRAIEAAGFETRTLDTTEFRKADGALTCLSLPAA